ncbi:hypothetical protein [Mesorhizobium sp. 8]|uniref:hypothetical protein n=1 Tax=Mesorhizobium sp. 8 TaxID=2584466 RepID=UPI001121A529|nr:hypothetical protein [Mesorhizobium sp. 8]QDC00028.1 hypothetical protein FGU64_06130 [Mesorhizobium sp. 8]
MLSEEKYAIASIFLSDRFLHEISFADFARYRKSYLFLLEYMTLEELVLQNLYAFEDYEKFILESALHNHLFPLSEYHFHQDHRIRANIKVVGFLNSVTSLRDQFPKFRESAPEKGIRDDFIKFWNEEKSKSIPFEFCEAFRNYAQHQTQPVAYSTSGSNWDESRALSEAHATVYADVTDVCKNRNISPDKREKFFKEFGLKADISLIFRETVGKIGKIIEKIREETRSEFEISAKIYKDILDTYRYNDEDVIVFDIVRISEGKRYKEFSIFLEFLERAKNLRRTFLIKNNECHLVSNRAFGHKTKPK